MSKVSYLPTVFWVECWAFDSMGLLLPISLLYHYPFKEYFRLGQKAGLLLIVASLSWLTKTRSMSALDKHASARYILAKLGRVVDDSEQKRKWEGISKTNILILMPLVQAFWRSGKVAQGMDRTSVRGSQKTLRKCPNSLSKVVNLLLLSFHLIGRAVLFLFSSKSAILHLPGKKDRHPLIP